MALRSFALLRYLHLTYLVSFCLSLLQFTMSQLFSDTALLVYMCVWVHVYPHIHTPCKMFPEKNGVRILKSNTRKEKLISALKILRDNNYQPVSL